MASANTRKKSGKDSPRFPVTALIVVAVVVLSAVIWHLVRGDGDRITAPFDARLLELAAGRGVPDYAISADDPIRKVGDVFVRTWRFGFPNQAARDGFLGDLELEAAQRGASLAFPEELGNQTIDLQVGFEVEVFDLQLSLQTACAAVAPIPQA